MHADDSISPRVDANDLGIPESFSATPVAACGNVLLDLIRILSPLDDVVRRRTVDAALTFLGTSPIHQAAPAVVQPLSHREHSVGAITRSENLEAEGADIPRRAQVWLTQNSISAESLEGVFHRTADGFDLIVHALPARTNKDRVMQCYILTGLKNLLTSGEPRFKDEDARSVCRDMGCYDKGNHATYVKGLGNLVAGSKSGAYELTQPGLRAGAEIIRNIING